MNVRVRPRATVVERDLPFECIALVLQGGGALGAYQAGVYEALAEVGIYPNWVAGISIGAINCAIIAGNPPEARTGNGTLLDGVLAGRSRGMEATQAVYPFKGRIPNCSSDLAKSNNAKAE